MQFFEQAFEREGDAGVVRLEKELAVLDWSVRGQTSWKVQTTSPFFDLEWKRDLISKRLTSQGLSPLLVDLVSTPPFPRPNAFFLTSSTQSRSLVIPVIWFIILIAAF